MHIIVPDASVRPYQLMGLNYAGQQVYEHRFAMLEALARAASFSVYEVARNRESWPPRASQAVRQKAISPRGSALPLDELVVWGHRLRLAGYRGRYHNFVFRSGSVSGISKCRGGPRTRNHQVQNERRGTALVVHEEGEVPARAWRLDGYLPNSWDDRGRIRQRSWKSQHNGCKSWNRPTPHGKGVQA